jgi:hypothetical protein
LRFEMHKRGLKTAVPAALAPAPAPALDVTDISHWSLASPHSVRVNRWRAARRGGAFEAAINAGLAPLISISFEAGLARPAQSTGSLSCCAGLGPQSWSGTSYAARAGRNIANSAQCQGVKKLYFMLFPSHLTTMRYIPRSNAIRLVDDTGYRNYRNNVRGSGFCETCTGIDRSETKLFIFFWLRLRHAVSIWNL